MTKSNIYTLLCTAVRLAAVALFVEACIGMVAAVASLRTTEASIRLFVFLEPVVQFVFAVLLWLFPGIFARLAASRKSLEVFESDVTPAVLQYLAFSVLGLWYAIAGISQLAYTVHRWVFMSMYLQQGMGNPTIDPKVYGNILAELAKVVLGIALAFGARGLVALLRRVRGEELQPPSSETTDS